MWALNTQQCAVVLHSSLSLQTQGMRIQSLGDLEENNQIGTTDTGTLPCPAMHCPALVWAVGEGGEMRWDEMRVKPPLLHFSAPQDLIVPEICIHQANILWSLGKTTGNKHGLLVWIHSGVTDFSHSFLGLKIRISGFLPSWFLPAVREYLMNDASMNSEKQTTHYWNLDQEVCVTFTLQS